MYQCFSDGITTRWNLFQVTALCIFQYQVCLCTTFQAYRLEPLVSAGYSSIPPVQLHRFDSKQAGYSETKPGKTGATGKWGGLLASYRVGFSKQKTGDEANDKTADLNSEENMEEDDVVIVHNASTKEGTVGTTSSYTKPHVLATSSWANSNFIIHTSDVRRGSHQRKKKKSKGKQHNETREKLMWLCTSCYVANVNQISVYFALKRCRKTV